MDRNNDGRGENRLSDYILSPGFIAALLGTISYSLFILNSSDPPGVVRGSVAVACPLLALSAVASAIVLLVSIAFSSSLLDGDYKTFRENRVNGVARFSSFYINGLLICAAAAALNVVLISAMAAGMPVLLLGPLFAFAFFLSLWALFYSAGMIWHLRRLVLTRFIFLARQDVPSPNRAEGDAKGGIAR